MDRKVPSVGKALWSLLAKGTTDTTVPSVGKALWSLLAKGTTDRKVPSVGKALWSLLAKGTTGRKVPSAGKALWSLLTKGTTEIRPRQGQRDHSGDHYHSSRSVVPLAQRDHGTRPQQPKGPRQR